MGIIGNDKALKILEFRNYGMHVTCVSGVVSDYIDYSESVID